jgi:hypothetical protein
MRSNVAALALLAITGCITDDGADENAAGTTEALLCLPNFGGHEVCDGADNDCDGTVDESCGPIDLDALPSLGCHARDHAEVTTDGSIIAKHFYNLDLIPAAGATQLAVSSVLPHNVFALRRSASGRVFLFGTAVDTTPGTPNPLSIDVQAVENDATLGPIVAHQTGSGSSGAWPSGAAVDGAGRFLIGGPDGVVRRWNGTAFVPWSTVINTQQVLMAVTADGSTAYLAGNVNDPYAANGKLVKMTTVASAIIDDAIYFPGGRPLRHSAVEIDEFGRIYLVTFCALGPPPDKSPCGAVFRYEKRQKRPVLVAASAVTPVTSVGIDPSTNELVLYRGSADGDPACVYADGYIVRVPL